MSWEQLKKLSKNGLASLGILPAAYAPLTDMDQKQVSALINRAVVRHREEFGSDPAFFAYPYGETSSGVRKTLSEYSFAAGFGQQSGVAHGGSDILFLPRFTMTDSFGDLERFRLTASALPLPVSEIVPEDMLIHENPPSVGFTITPEITDISKLSCFISGVGKADLARLGDNRVEIRMDQPLVDRRTRVNCTIPDDTIIPGQAQSWRWFGMLMTVADAGETAPPASNPPSEGIVPESE